MNLRLLPVCLILSGIVSSAFANTAVIPVPKDEDWLKRHEGFLAEAARGGIDVLFLGDSITDGWRSIGKDIWDVRFAPLRAANFGIDGDRTQHVLWRLGHGDVPGFAPRVVVLMIGTNNTGRERQTGLPRNTTGEATAGVITIVRTLREKWPASRVLLLGIFPRGERDSPEREQVAEINRALAALHDGVHVHFLDIGTHFLAPDGSIPRNVMPDLLHPNEAGYRIWADAVEAPLMRLLAP